MKHINQIKFVILITTLLLFSNCKEAKTDPMPIQTEHHIDSVKPYANPILIYGSNFGRYWQALYRIGNYEAILKFTATKTRIKFGSTKLLKFYRDSLKFDYELGRLTNTYSAGDTITLVYSNAKIMATRKLIRLKVIVECDSSKMILSNLNSNPFY